MFETHLEDTDPSIPLFYIAALYICNFFNMCNILFVIEWNFKAIFLIVQFPWINTIKILIDVWNTFTGYIKLQEYFRFIVMRLNIDIKIHADEKTNFNNVFFGSLDFAIFKHNPG